MFALFKCVICLPLYILGLRIHENALGTIFLGLYFIYVLAILIPGLAVTVRRLHDTGKSGWWLLIAFVPIVGGLICACVRGAWTANRERTNMAPIPREPSLSP